MSLMVQCITQAFPTLPQEDESAVLCSSPWGHQSTDSLKVSFFSPTQTETQLSMWPLSWIHYRGTRVYFLSALLNFFSLFFRYICWTNMNTQIRKHFTVCMLFMIFAEPISCYHWKERYRIRFNRPIIQRNTKSNTMTHDMTQRVHSLIQLKELLNGPCVVCDLALI